MKLYKIIDEIWEENQHNFNSKQELQAIVNGYLLAFHRDLKSLKNGKLEGIGSYQIARNGTSFLKRKAKSNKLKQQKQTKKAMTKRRAWRLKFIDDCFPD